MHFKKLLSLIVPFCKWALLKLVADSAACSTENGARRPRLRSSYPTWDWLVELIGIEPTTS